VQKTRDERGAEALQSAKTQQTGPTKPKTTRTTSPIVVVAKQGLWGVLGRNKWLGSDLD